MQEFCICNGSDTEFCPFHDPRILKMDAENEVKKTQETSPAMENPCVATATK